MSTTYVPDRAFWLQYWRGIYAVPRAWAMKGENLVHAFEAVAQASRTDSVNFDLRDQAFMLAGMAIEVLLKALIVNDPQKRDVASGVRKPTTPAEVNLLKSFYRHNLVELAPLAGMPLTPDQEGTLQALSAYIYWKGRYVMPTERGIDDIVPVEGPDGLVGEPLRAVSVQDAEAFIELVIAQVHLQLWNRV